jgi:non-ribosomal peptide synthetase component E (peptide arylation enzyme)
MSGRTRWTLGILSGLALVAGSTATVSLGTTTPLGVTVFVLTMLGVLCVMSLVILG